MASTHPREPSIRALLPPKFVSPRLFPYRVHENDALSKRAGRLKRCRRNGGPSCFMGITASSPVPLLACLSFFLDKASFLPISTPSNSTRACVVSQDLAILL
ncbi:hypothetical protein K439DRAFT_599664 [Ramaria rubella]|nr:hypothetical protein K439DRAFT_599664 [Ramaria rubella]